VVVLWQICKRNLVGIAVCFSGDLFLIYCFMYGCFESMDFCVSHTFFISSLTYFTSAAYTLLVAFMRFAIWFRLLLILESVVLYSRKSE